MLPSVTSHPVLGGGHLSKGWVRPDCARRMENCMLLSCRQCVRVCVFIVKNKTMALCLSLPSFKGRVRTADASLLGLWRVEVTSRDLVPGS